ncbi:MAG: Na+/H+ antiporter NhaC family protein [bacterium]|nr:Na+/H+ antiporter NhaC family protein [bacterium]
MRKSTIIVAVLGLVALVLLPRVPVDGDYLLRHTLEEEMFPEVLSHLNGQEVAANSAISINVEGPLAHEIRYDLQDFLLTNLPQGDIAKNAIITLAWSIDDGIVDIQGSVRTLNLETFIRQQQHLLSWISLLPPLIAILLAFAFRRTLICLFVGIWAGATLLFHGNVAKGLVWVAYEGILRHALLDQFRIEILVFIFGLVGAVGIMSRMGGVAGMLRLVEGAVRSARSAQFFTAVMGLLIFFDDYANTILVGTTMRPLSDRWRVSRERLAYLVDSTAAPVAGLSVLSTWVAYEMSLYADQLPMIGVEQDAYIIFLRTIPFRFYSIFTLLLVMIGAVTGRSFGPMLKAERRARAGAVSPVVNGDRGVAERMASTALKRTSHKPGVPARWWNAVLPLGLIIGVTLCLMFSFGDVEQRGLDALGDVEYLRSVVLSNTNSTRALAWAAVSGFLLALFLARGQRLLGWGEALAAGVGNFRAMLEAIGILILAWVMGHICDLLGTSHVLIAMANGGLDRMALLLPLILFLTGAAVSFATGSSWSTMAILLPNVVLLAGRIGEATTLGTEGMLLLAIGAVLEGSIFGDHCSPISDTTILSSVASGCPHMAHVKTQIPIALAALFVAVFVGYLPVALGVPVWLILPTGAIVLLLIIRLLGRCPEDESRMSV